MEPQISIIMPVYNASKFLRLAIESVIKQSFSNFEFIIIDDGSTDNSATIVSLFNDKRIIFFQNKHCGYVEQLNFGLKKAKCNIIARMDSDDIWEKNKLKIQYEFIKINPEYKLVGTNCTFINENGKNIFEKKYPESHEQIIDQISYYNPMCHPSIMFYKDIVLNVGGYNADMEPIEDYDLYLRLLEKGIKVYNIQESLVDYRIHKQSASSNQILKQKGLMKNAANNYVSRHFEKKNYEYLFRRGLIEYYHGDISQSRLFFVKSIRIATFSKKKQIMRYLFLSLIGGRLLNKFRTSNYFFMFKRKIHFLNKHNLTQT